MKEYASLYLNELINNVIPFWEKHSIDLEAGGYFTCLDRQGNVYDTDKFMWLQGRQVWTFSMLYNQLEQKQDWLSIAEHGASFMQQYGMDEAGNWYFSLDRYGKPLIQPYNIFSDCFAAMGFAALYRATNKQEYAQLAERTFQNILKRQHNWKGIYNKSYPGTRPLKNFSLPMILCNLSLELEEIIGSQIIDDSIPGLVNEIMHVFYNEEKGIILESVLQDGSFSDSFEGRLVNPGHIIEAMWFIIDLAERINDTALIKHASDILIRTLEYGWDNEYGGIFYFKDILNKPLQQLEWDQKLWWVHAETLVALAKAYKHNPSILYQEWFEKVHNYTWNKFRDPEYGEWFGYLNRKGEILLNTKGGKWKGCFHVPRSLYQVYTTLSAL